MSQNVQENQICGVFGTGRSGSTWLGSILNSHPETVYRFEPFHRLREKSNFIKAITRREAEALNDNTLKQAYSLLIQADPALEKPPFFKKSHSTIIGRSLLWPIARKLSVASSLFSTLYTPRGCHPLVFKEVDLESLMANMLNNTTIPIVYLVRHPFGVISSLLEGQAKHMMGTGRIKILDSLMRNHDSALADRYNKQLSSLNPAQLNALLWRMDVEKAWRCMNGNPQALLLFYEDLCKNTEERARAVFRHFNIDFADEVKEFISKSTKADHDSSLGIDEITQDSYFSVYRDPSISMNKWKSRLSEVDRNAILSVFAGSEAVETYFSFGHWET